MVRRPVHGFAAPRRRADRAFPDQLPRAPGASRRPSARRRDRRLEPAQLPVACPSAGSSTSRMIPDPGRGRIHVPSAARGSPTPKAAASRPRRQAVTVSVPVSQVQDTNVASAQSARSVLSISALSIAAAALPSVAGKRRPPAQHAGHWPTWQRSRVRARDQMQRRLTAAAGASDRMIKRLNTHRFRNPATHTRRRKCSGD
jgi:hypothetical protein